MADEPRRGVACRGVAWRGAVLISRRSQPNEGPQRRAEGRVPRRSSRTRMRPAATVGAAQHAAAGVVGEAAEQPGAQQQRLGSQHLGQVGAGVGRADGGGQQEGGEQGVSRHHRVAAVGVLVH